MSTEARVVLSTFPDRDTAARIGKALVEARHAACVNLVPGVESIYRWEGNIETATETLAIFKVTEMALEGLIAELDAAHPYEVPEIVALPIEAGSAPYLEWLGESCGGIST